MKKFQATKKHINKLIEIAVILFMLIILFSPNTPFKFIAKGVVAVFGFVGYWILTPFILIISIYLLFKNKFFKKIKPLKIFICVGILTFVLSVGFSIYHTLNIDNFSSEFKALISEYKGTLPSFEYGGGFIGFLFAGLLTTALTKVGLYLVLSAIVIVLLVIIFFKQIKNLFLKLKNKKHSKKEEPEENVSEVKEENTEPEDNEDVVNETRNDSSTELSETKLKKAHFNMEENSSESSNNIPANEIIPTLVVAESIENEPISEVVQTEETGEKNVEETIDENCEDAVIENESNIETTLTKPVFDESNIEVTPKVEEPVVENVDPLHRPQPKANLDKDYVFPSLDLLKFHESDGDIHANEASCQNRIEIINKTFENLKIGAQVVGYTVGPTVTRYDVQMNYDVSVNAITKYIRDISIRLGGVKVRFEEIVFGKSTSGLEIPNETRTNVGLRESMEKIPVDDKHKRYIPFGKNITGDLVSANLADFPHMLVSGTTGSGKTIFIHSTILALLLRNKPEDLKILLIDPKKVEMGFYKDIPHLLCPNISEPKEAYVALKRLVDEMERRYNLFCTNGVRDIKGFNEFANRNNIQPLPYIVLFVDEFADLMDSCKEVREPIVRLAQKARAAGIHLVLATQRPSVNVIDGVIKGNISTRVALLSASSVDSVTIIGEGGAEKLLGNGDMLIESPLLSTSGKPRVQGCFVEIEEIENVCNFLRSHYKTQYDPYFLNLKEPEPVKESEPEMEAIDKSLNEELQYQKIKEQICLKQYCSISFIQRTFGMGFPRAGRIFARLQREGVVAQDGDARGNKVLTYTPGQQQMGTIEQSSFIPDDENE